MTPDLPHHEWKIEPGLLLAWVGKEEHCWSSSMGCNGGLPLGVVRLWGLVETLALTPLLRGKIVPANKVQGTALASGELWPRGREKPGRYPLHKELWQ